jgi:hypothetical protein
MMDIEEPPSTSEAASTTEEVGTTDRACTTEETGATQPGTDSPDAPASSDKPALLQELVAAIRAAVAPGVSSEARAAGAAACRAILTALEAQVGQPLVATTSGSTTAGATSEPASALARLLSRLVAMPREQLTGLMSQLAAMPREQLVEFLVNRVRGSLPPGPPTHRVSSGPRFHLIQIPQVRPPRSGT